MRFLERDLEDIIFNTHPAILSERGLVISEYRRRQVSVGNYGIADIISYSREFYGDFHHEEVTIFELKKDVINIDAIAQCIRYMKGVNRFFEVRRGKNGRIPRIKGVVIGSKVDSSTDLIYLPDLINGNRFGLSIKTFSYEVSGIYFNSHFGYKLIDEGF